MTNPNLNLLEFTAVEPEFNAANSHLLLLLLKVLDCIKVKEL